MEEIPNVEMRITDENDSVNCISLVEKPAIESNFVHLSENSIEMKIIDEEKRIVVGAVLIPNKKIYRDVNGKQFNMFFKADTIEQLAERYMEKHNISASTLEHDESATGVFTKEIWIVEDEKKDKQNLYGLSHPVGTWMEIKKINNDDVWKGVKDGTYKGYSIEAGLKEYQDYVSLSKIESEDERLVNEIYKLL
jgi:hypothetical protein